MTPQTRLVLLGVAAGALTKFYFQKPAMTALLVGLATISAVAVLTAKDADTNAS